MREQTCLVVDTWEGQMEIDEGILQANQVYGIGIRLNDMNGGHHLDTNFEKQWLEARGFARFPYFVYNPWVSGSRNFDWLKANIPSSVIRVAIDIEVRYSEISPRMYQSEVATFLRLCDVAGLKTLIYTGQGYSDLLASWPKEHDYWWAQYPSTDYYFRGVSSWYQLKTALDSPNLVAPFNKNKIPGKLKLWQIGDKFVLPGNARMMDVNVFFGTEAELRDYFKEKDTEQVVVTKVTSNGVVVSGDIEVEYKLYGKIFKTQLTQT